MNSPYTDPIAWLKFLGILATLAILWLLFIKWMARLQKRWYAMPSDAAQIASEVGKLPIQDAKEEAIYVLNSANKFSFVNRRENIPANLSARLGPALREFFERYERVTCLIDDLRLELREPVTWDLDHRYLIIGHITEDVILLVKENHDAICEWDRTVPSDLQPITEQLKMVESPVYSSVYHLITAIHRDWIQRNSAHKH